MQRLSRRNFLKTTLGASVTFSSFGCEFFKSKKKPLNILYIMTDQQPTGTMGCYGNPLKPTPHLDRLAESGMRFDNFYISAFPCSPSRASMLTGCYPQKHGVFTNDVLLEDDIPSMGFILRDSGRNTGYFGKSHLKGYYYRNVPRAKDAPRGKIIGTDGLDYADPEYDGNWFFRRVRETKNYQFEKIKGGYGEDHPQLGFDRWAGGWKDYRTYLSQVGLGYLVDQYPLVGNHYDIPSTKEGEHMYSLIPEEHHMASFFTKKAVQFIRDQRGNNRSFCMVLSYFGPHHPVAPPRPWDTRYSLDRCPLPDNHYDALENKPAAQKNNRSCYRIPDWTKEQFKDYIRRYYGYSAYVDQQIGRVLKALSEYGFDENTVVIFTSDHGDLMGAHGFIYKTGTCGYEELVNVPFIIRAPGITKPGSMTECLASHVDILPTLMDVLGLPKQNEMQGESFHSLLTKSQNDFRERVFTHMGLRSFLMSDGEWKYILHWKSEIDELYNLKDDPGEMKNLMTETKHTEIARKKREDIFAWLHETSHPYANVIFEETKQKF